MLQDNVMQLSKLTVFQRKDADRIWRSCCAVLDQQFCNSWTVAAVWIPGGRVSETKVNALAQGRPR